MASISVSSPQLQPATNPRHSHYDTSFAPASYQSNNLPYRSIDAARLSLSTSPSSALSGFRYPPAHIPLDASPATIQRFEDHSPASLLRQQQLQQHYQNIHSAGQYTGLEIGASLSRSVSADAAAPSQPPQQPSSQLVQRLAQQNAQIREAWEAERNYLEANRRRAEEVYQEERAIMEDFREAWIQEKEEMQREMATLRERLQRLEGENSALRALASPRSQVSGLVSPEMARSMSSDAAGDSRSRAPTKQTAAARASSTHADADSLPPGLEGAAKRPHFSSPGAVLSPGLHPIDPRTQPQTSSQHDFLASGAPPSDSPVPTIDVQQIDPKLDGIRIRATVLQSNFGASIATPPPSITSPPNTEQQPTPDMQQQGASEQQPASGQSPQQAATEILPPLSRSTSKEQTLQVLAAGPSTRRTMHAGHTPNHSISMVPTMTATDSTAANSVAGQSEATTPKAKRNEDRDHPETDHEDSDSANELQHYTSYTEPPEPAPTKQQVEDGEVEPQFEPEDDVPLKGPLMVKNIPAQDEIFWALVDKKLEPISHGEDALPTVIKSRVGSLDSQTDGASASGSGLSPPAKKTLEPDIPLKLKKSTNFGVPFGFV